jgi:hypothetical protein
MNDSGSARVASDGFVRSFAFTGHTPRVITTCSEIARPLLAFGYEPQGF